MSIGIRTRRWPAGVRLLVLATALLSVAWVLGAATRHRPVQDAAAPVTQPGRLAHHGGTPGMPGPGGNPTRRILVLYDQDPDFPALGHQYAIQAANLASRGGTWTMLPVAKYRAGGLSEYQSAIYTGVADNPLPDAFLTDVLRDDVPVLWMGAGIDQLFEKHTQAARELGWHPSGAETRQVTKIEYAGQTLARKAADNVDLTRISVGDPSRATVLAQSRHDDGSADPWAVRSGSLTYIGDMPFSDVDTGDRYLAAADLILRQVDPQAPRRHRALIRIEDVGPHTKPQEIIAIADLFASRGVPFSLAVFPFYRDPHGAQNHGKPTEYRLVDKPELVDALKYAVERGGVIIMHGYSHQFEDRDNPYTGASGGDYEFYLAHVDQDDYVRLDGPVPFDSKQWAGDRIAVGRGEFLRAGLADPDIFEFPHYTGSLASYQAVGETFGVRYDQGSYFDGQCPQGDCRQQTETGEMFQQYFPYPVRDVYGSLVIPENLQNVSEAYNHNPARTPADILAAAAAMSVVHDSVASTFYHPFLGVQMLAQIIDGIKALGFTFVSPYDLIE